MDFRVHVTKEMKKTSIVLVFGFVFSPCNAFASGDLNALYSGVINYLLFLVAISIIVSSLKSKERINSICIFVICLPLDLIVFLTVPFVKYKTIILIFSFVNLLILFVYIFLQMKIATKFKNKARIKK